MIHVQRFKGSFVLDKNLDDLQLSPIRRPVECIQTGIDPAAGINSPRKKIFDDMGAAIETGARECLRQRLRFVSEEAAFIPLNDRTRRTIGRSIKQRRKTGKVPSHKSAHCVLERYVTPALHCFHRCGTHGYGLTRTKLAATGKSDLYQD